MSLYEEIFFSFRENIERGIYPPGERLPSIRETANRFQCNKITVQKAFDRLKAEGFIENQVGRGSFVRHPMHPVLKPHIGYPFHSACIGDELFPSAAAGEIFSTIFREEKHLFDTGPMGGDADLVRSLSSRYRVSPESTIIISGAQQGLNLCSTLYNLDVSEQIVFEDPTYSGAISIFRPRHFVPLLDDGPDLDVLRNLVQEKVRFFYTIPQVHNPTGTCYSERKMDIIAEYALKYDFLVIEDDYLSEFSDTPRARFIDRIPNNTIYIKSLSKITAPGIRLGFMTVPATLYRNFIHGKYSADLGTSFLMQRFFNRFITSGLMDTHLNTCRLILRERRKIMERMLDAYPFLKVRPGQAGYNIWVQSDVPLTIERPPWAGGENFSYSSHWKDSFRLSLLSMNDEDFNSGIALLGSLFQSLSHPDQRPVL